MVNYLKILIAKFRYQFYSCLFALLLGICLAPYYSDGSFILGGEGGFVLNFKSLFENFGFAWTNMATGVPATSLNFNYFSTFFFILLQNLKIPMPLINFILIYLLYFLPFIAMFLVSCELKIGPLLAFAISVFYVINPFSTYFLMSLNQWNSLILFMIPFAFYLILKFYAHSIKLFLYFGIFSFLFAFVNANPPLMVVYQLSLLFSTFFVHLYLEPSFKPVTFIKKYVILLISFGLFNLWWILNWLQALSSDVSKMYTADFAVRHARDLVKAYKPLMLKIFSLTSLISSSNITNYLSEFYNSTLSYIVVLVPIMILAYFFYKNFPKRASMRFLICTVLLTMLLSNGPSGFFGFIYEFALSHVPLFSVFKTPPEKWGVLSVFCLSLLLVLSLRDLKTDRHAKSLISLFSVYLIFCAIPFFTSRFIPDYKMADGNLSSRKYFDRNEYRLVREQLYADQPTYRILSLPGSTNYQVSLLMYDNKHYTGMDPVVNNVNKQFIAAYSTNYLMNFDIIFDNFSLPYISRLFPLFNIGKIVINKDTEPWFGYKEFETTSMLESLFSRDMDKEGEGAILIYTPKNFLPRFYAASHTALIRAENQALVPLTQTSLVLDNPALFFINQDNRPNDTITDVLGHVQFDSVVLADNVIGSEKDTAAFSKGNTGKINHTYLFSGIDLSNKDIEPRMFTSRVSKFYTAGPSKYLLKAILSFKKGSGSPLDQGVLSQPIFEIDSHLFFLEDLKHEKGLTNDEKIVVHKELSLPEGAHTFQKMQHDVFDVSWIIIEPRDHPSGRTKKPWVIFKRVNPAKYLVEIKNADEPFWLVFNETFHKKWRIYPAEDACKLDNHEQVTALHKNAHVQELRHTVSFCPSDLRYLFDEPFEAAHYQVNGYANAWYIDPKTMGLPENFSLTVFYWPQTLFYFGMAITIITFLGTILFICFKFFEQKKNAA